MRGRKVAIRVALVVGGFALAWFVLSRALSGFDISAVGGTLGDLTWGDVAKLSGAFIALLVAEACLSASFVPGMSLGRGAIAWLASNAVASVIPGPSDMPLRYRMFRSWGLRTADAATATAGATVANVASKMVLPALAAVALAVGDVEVGSVRNIVVSGCVMFLVVVVVVGFTFGTERRTAAGARLVARLIRRPGAVAAIVRSRNEAVALVQRTWKKTLIGLVFTTACMVVLFVWCIRAVGIDSDSAAWLALFSVWALVRGVTVLPTMPGDAGVSELAFVSLLNQVAQNQSVNTVTAGIVLYRLLTWIAPIPLGVVAIGLWRWTLRRHPDRPVGSAPDPDAVDGYPAAP